MFLISRRKARPPLQVQRMNSGDDKQTVTELIPLDWSDVSSSVRNLVSGEITRQLEMIVLMLLMLMLLLQVALHCKPQSSIQILHTAMVLQWLNATSQLIQVKQHVRKALLPQDFTVWSLPAGIHTAELIWLQLWLLYKGLMNCPGINQSSLTDCLL